VELAPILNVSDRDASAASFEKVAFRPIGTGTGTDEG
jgi:hypothetical protein